MYESRHSKVLKAIARHNDAIEATGEQHGRSIKAALLSIAEAYPNLLPMVISNSNCRDDRTGYVIWDRVRESLAINQNTDSSLSALKIRWQNASRFIPNGVKGLLQYKHDTTSLCVQYNRLSVGTAFSEITDQDQLEELLSALRNDRYSTDRTGKPASRWADFLDRQWPFRIPANDGGHSVPEIKTPSLATFLAAGLDSTWATLELWSKDKKVTVAHNDEIDLLAAVSHTRGAAPTGSAATAMAVGAARHQQHQRTAHPGSQPSAPRYAPEPRFPAAARAADGCGRQQTHVERDRHWHHSTPSTPPRPWRSALTARAATPVACGGAASSAAPTARAISHRGTWHATAAASSPAVPPWTS